jgi:deoxyribodipyrimidine photo-lyase
MSLVQSYEEILAQVDAIDPVVYGKTRNHLGGAVTRLSPYISRGVITLPQIKARLLARHRPADCAKLLQELSWREYFQNVWWAKGEAIFSDLRFSRDDWEHHELVSALVGAETGIVVLDEAVKELYETGYMHNHVRMWVASVSCNIARAHWYGMGQWLYYHLVDGDLASNFLSWQWVVGTSVQKRYTTCQSLMNACSDTKQSHSWLSLERDATLTMPIPEHLLLSEPIVLPMEYPVVPEVSTVSGAEVYLYTPWTLDPMWRRVGGAGGDDSGTPPARRLLIIDPTWFDRFPVSPLVLDFIIRQGQTVIPELEVFVGDAHDVPGIADATAVYTKAHPTNTSWPGMHDPRELLAPAATGYYPSFFKYWQRAERTVLHL